MHFASLLAGLLATSAVSAHPGHDHHAELAERQEALRFLTRRDLSHCAEKIKARGLESRNVQRRSELASNIVAKRHLKGKRIL
jgi:hypothetical protein